MMTELAALTILGLSTYILRKLQRKLITTTRQFLDTDNRELIELTKLQESDVREIKRKICELYFPRPQSLLTLKQRQQELLKYTTGIVALDEMLVKIPFMAGSCWEICGKSGVGKTQVCHTIAVHLAADLHCVVLYIDTKGDFSGTRFLEMLRERGLDKEACGRIMHEVLVERTYSAAGICDILQALLTLKAAAEETEHVVALGIKMVIIDALPAVWLNLVTNKEQLKGKYLLATLTNLMYKLSNEYNVAFLLVNLLVNVDEENDSSLVAMEDVYESDGSDTCVSMLNVQNYLTMTRPALGAYWKHVPRLRLAMEFDATATGEPTQRILRVLQSCYTAEGDTCKVHITAAGVM